MLPMLPVMGVTHCEWSTNVKQPTAGPGGRVRVQSVAHVPGGVLWVEEWVGVRGPAHEFIFPGAYPTAQAAGVALDPTYRETWKWAFSPHSAWMCHPVEERATGLADSMKQAQTSAQSWYDTAVARGEIQTLRNARRIGKKKPPKLHRVAPRTYRWA
jgi:hypothetical protein